MKLYIWPHCLLSLVLVFDCLVIHFVIKLFNLALRMDSQDVTQIVPVRAGSLSEYGKPNSNLDTKWSSSSIEKASIRPTLRTELGWPAENRRHLHSSPKITRRRHSSQWYPKSDISFVQVTFWWAFQDSVSRYTQGMGGP